ncbi:MAG: hemerythrin domain-containing protein [Alphaproteobacteria bacterium]|nr:hemerythrin domain-containing protein [Alphaproteobacteria bacterium]
MLERVEQAAMRQLLAGHDQQLALCETLEQIADALPNDVDTALCHRTAARLHTVMQEATAFEKIVLLESLGGDNIPNSVDLRQTARRLLRESDEDLSHAEELQDALNQVGSQRPGLSTDALGYLLRGFFEARKRRIALEREVAAALLAKPTG